MRLNPAALGLVIGLALSGAACASGSSASDNEVEEQIGATVELDAVESDATITVVGGDGGTISFDELEALEMHAVEIFEPFVEADTTFQGPKLVDVFAALGLSSGEVEVLALNDYGFTAEIEAWPADALLATRENGELIDVENGGPFRVVFPDDSPWAPELETWVWSVDRFVVG